MHVCFFADIHVKDFSHTYVRVKMHRNGSFCLLHILQETYIVPEYDGIVG